MGRNSGLSALASPSAAQPKSDSHAHNNAAGAATRKPAINVAEGIAGLDPQRDMPVELHKRTMTPIGAPSSPAPLNADVPRSFSHMPFTSPLTSPYPRVSQSASAIPTWAPDECVGATASAHAFDSSDQLLTSALNDSLESLNLGPPVLDRNTRTAPHLSGNQHSFLNSRVASPPYEPKHTHHKHNDARSAPSHAPRSRSILLRNVPPGVDDESLRSLLERYGQVRHLGAQQRMRGGRGSVVAAFYDLRHAQAAIKGIDGFHFYGRRIEARFHNAPSAPTVPRSPILTGIPPNRNNSNDSSPNARHSPCSTVTSPYQSPAKQIITSPTNQGTLVVFNLDPNTSAEEIRALFGVIGDVKEIRETPNKRHHKFVEFFDVRDAERALQALNKTEVGGKKIKIEISRPGGRSNSRNSAHNAPATTANGDHKHAAHLNGISQGLATARTPPSIPLSSLNLPTNGGRSHGHAMSPLEGHHMLQSQSGSLSPYSAQYSASSYASMDIHQGPVSGNRMTAANQHRNLGHSTGSTLNAQAHAYFPQSLNGTPMSPSNAYNNGSQQTTSPYGCTSYTGGADGSLEGLRLDQYVGDTNSREYVEEPYLNEISRSLEFRDERLRLDLRSVMQPQAPPPLDKLGESIKRCWANYQTQQPSSGSSLPARSPVGVAGPRQSSLNRFLGSTVSAEPGYGTYIETESRTSPGLSPSSFPQLARNSRNRSYYGETNLGGTLNQYSAGAPGSGYSGGSSPHGKETQHYANNVNGTVSPFPRAGSTTPDRIGEDLNEPAKDVPRRKYSTVLQMGGSESAGGRRSSGSASSRSHGGSNTHRDRDSHSNKYTLHIEKVISGEDARTALMIRNIPNKYSQRMLLNTLDTRHRGRFDFIYLPIDFKNKCNVGYAFINFKSTEFMPAFFHEFHGHKWGRFNSEKVCEICYARIQGKSNLIGHFQNSSLMNEDPKCRPVIFNEKGEQEEFPVGTNVRTRRGPSAREASRLQEHSPSFSPLKQRSRCN